MTKWKQLLAPNNKSKYINLNEETGEIVFCKRVSNALPIPSRTSVAQIVAMRAKGRQIDDWFMKHFSKWEKAFAKENLDTYNSLINK